MMENNQTFFFRYGERPSVIEDFTTDVWYKFIHGDFFLIFAVKKITSLWWLEKWKFVSQHLKGQMVLYLPVADG